MVFIGANAAGLNNKIDSLLRIISVFNPGVIFIQETKARRKNKVKLYNYECFESIRDNSDGGGVLTAVHKALEPIQIPVDDENEIVVVEATLKMLNKKVRLINGYGPQENLPEDKRRSFYNQIDLEIKKAQLAGALVIIEMDSNAKLGSSLVPNDPKEQSENGKLLERVIKENDMIVVNGTELCEGAITRFRETVNGVEESVIDHFIVCKNTFQLVTEMVIDEAGTYSLTKYSNKSGTQKLVKPSDHRTLFLTTDLSWKTEVNDGKTDRVEVFNYRNKEDFQTFINETSENSQLNN